MGRDEEMGEHEPLLKGSAKNVQKVRIRLHNLCCRMELKLIAAALDGKPGVQSHEDNVLGRVCEVLYDSSMITPAEIVVILNSYNLGASIKEKSASDNQSNAPMTACCLEVLGMPLTHIFAAETALAVGSYVTGWSFLLSLAVVVGCGDLALKVWRRTLALKAISLDMPTLIFTAAVGALKLGKASEAFAMLWLFAGSTLAEHAVLALARSKVEGCGDVLPRSAVLYDTGEEVPLSFLTEGSRIFVRTGEAIPADGTVFKYSGYVDESAITGEPNPKRKVIGSEVVTGGVVQDGPLGITVTATPDQSLVAGIQQMVESAASTRTATHRLLDEFGHRYSVCIISAAAAVFLFSLVTGGDSTAALHRALVLLVLGCPCALVTAAPIVTTCGIAGSAKRGVLIKSARALEQLATVRSVCFDKTGTITDGRFSVVDDWTASDASVDDVKKVIALEAASTHPLAMSIVSSFTGCMTEAVEHLGKTLALPKVDEFSIVEGVGVRGKVLGVPVAVGNEKFLSQPGEAPVPVPEDLRRFIGENRRQAKTLVFGVCGGAVVKAWTLFDTPRANSKEALSQLHSLNLLTAILSGDRTDVVRSVADTVFARSYHGDLLPKDKVLKIIEYAKRGPVCFVGDGVNDAPALASADVGWAIGSGAAMAASSADVVETRDDLTAVPATIQHSRKCHTLLKQNVAIAVGPKLFLAVYSIFATASTPLWLAVLFDSGCLLLVLLNGMRALF
ncbi:Cadmium/zinc-transporting ATPase HMA3 [Diplonema papillatum]|nr:Cadmium/zinc-transporting ATPase HMA3 [Diplonema papillatum]|eukprot:gene17300-26568_t